jgi:hypothetical protein
MHIISKDQTETNNSTKNRQRSEQTPHQRGHADDK